MAKILIVNSSARVKGNSRALSAKVAEGATKAGHAVKTVEIGTMPIKPCIGCETCQTTKPGECVFKDDMSALYPEIVSADILILSSPIYFFSMNGQMKQFMDRLYPLMESFKSKKIGAVFSYGDDDPVLSGAVNAVRILQDICRYLGIPWIGAMYGTVHELGAIDHAPELLVKAEAFGAAL